MAANMAVTTAQRTLDGIATEKLKLLTAARRLDAEEREAESVIAGGGTGGAARRLMETAGPAEGAAPVSAGSWKNIPMGGTGGAARRLMETAGGADEGAAPVSAGSWKNIPMGTGLGDGGPHGARRLVHRPTSTSSTNYTRLPVANTAINRAIMGDGGDGAQEDSLGMEPFTYSAIGHNNVGS